MELSKLSFEELEHILSSNDEPEPPKKPVIVNSNGLLAAQAYTKAIENYKNDFEEFRYEVADYRAYHNTVMDIWVQKLFDKIGCQSFSKEQHKLIFNEAYNNCESKGYFAIRQEFETLSSLFEEFIMIK